MNLAETRIYPLSRLSEVECRKRSTTLLPGSARLGSSCDESGTVKRAQVDNLLGRQTLKSPSLVEGFANSLSFLVEILSNQLRNLHDHIATA